MATATLHTTTAVVSADDCASSGRSAVILVDEKQSVTLPSVTDDDVVAIVENTPSDEWQVSPMTGSDTGGGQLTSPSPSPRRERLSTAASPVIHSAEPAQEAEAGGDIFRVVPGATLTSKKYSNVRDRNYLSKKEIPRRSQKLICLRQEL